MTQEFHISITPLGEDKYFVRTENVPVGCPLAEEIVEWPVEQWLAQARHLLGDPFTDILEEKSNSQVVIPDQIVARSGEVVSPSLVALGQEMYKELFKDTLRDSWNSAQAIANHLDKDLRLRLGIKDRRISSLPWEVLHADDRPIAIGNTTVLSDFVFSRYQPIVFSRSQPNTSLPKYTRVLTPGEPLKILMAIATPTDKDSLQLEKEYKALQEELQRNSGETQIHLDILHQPGREELTQKLEQGKYQVFHYAGHSNSGISGGEISLVSNITGLTESMSGNDLAGLLVNNGIQMAVFNSCRGAYNHLVHPTNERAEINLLEAMAKRGIPGVLAMAERIQDDVAIILTKFFYRNLKQGYPIDLSLNRARQGLISTYSSDQLSWWGLPVVYLHPDFDGYLIQQQNDSKNEIEEDILTSIDEKIESPNSPEDSTPVQPDIDPKQLEKYPTEPGTNNLNCQVEDGKNRVVMTDQELLKEREIIEQLNHQYYEKQEDLITPKESGEESTQPIFKFSWKKTLGYAVSGMMLLFGTNLISINRQPITAKLPKAPAPVLNYEYNRVRLVNETINNIPEVQNLAIEQFNQNDIRAGKLVVETLLERGELIKAEAAINAVPETLSNAPEINFLNGRLAWEKFQDTNQNNLIDQAISYWEKAAAKKPENIQYQNALGFAYYTKGEIKKAETAWAKVLILSGEIAPEIEKTRPVSYNNETNLSVKNREALNAYAGLGLVTLKYAQNLQITPVQAFKYFGKVMGKAGHEFHIRQLQKNWLWSPKARQDWDKLLKLRDQQQFKHNQTLETLT
ncbi:CHAT domain-containing protein [Dapis sp. BLCC M172]|uniref:CHAT domain-containing protein n=1 Tax=Dapis sp. BLCC M172 TaxID=2975281 RepID=UPI003CECAB03